LSGPSTANGTKALLDHRLDTILRDLSPAAAANALRGAGIRACCLENAEGEKPTAAASVNTVRDALDAVAEANPGYRWDAVPEGLVNVFPVRSVLDEEVPELRVAGKGLWSVLEEDVGLASHGIELFMEFRDGDGPPVPGDVPAGSLRSVLNRLIAPVAGTVWHISGRPGAYFLTITSIG
jgi:hypothetical protein